MPPTDSMVDAGGYQVTVTGENAIAFSKGYALTIRGGRTSEVWGHFVHRLERTAGDWRCGALAFTAVHSRGNDLDRTVA